MNKVLLLNNDNDKDNNNNNNNNNNNDNNNNNNNNNNHQHKSCTGLNAVHKLDFFINSKTILKSQCI
jgi:hypothetical protein